MIDRALLEAELADAKAQRDTAQQRLQAALTAQQQAQMDAQAAQALIHVASGAIQQLDALLKKMEAPKDATPSSSPQ